MIRDITIEEFGKITRMYKKLLKKYFWIWTNINDPQRNMLYLISVNIRKNNIKQKVHKFINSHTFYIIGNWIIAIYGVQSLKQNLYILKISKLFTKTKNKKIKTSIDKYPSKVDSDKRNIISRHLFAKYVNLCISSKEKSSIPKTKTLRTKALVRFENIYVKNKK